MKAEEIISHLEGWNDILINKIVTGLMDKEALRAVMSIQDCLNNDVNHFMVKTQGDVSKLREMTPGQIMRNGDPTDEINDLISIRRDVAIVVDKSQTLLEVISKDNPTKEDIKNCIDKEKLTRGKEAVDNAIEVLSKAADVDSLVHLNSIIYDAQKILDIN